MQRLLFALPAALALLAAGNAGAQSNPAELRLRTLAATCANCHGTDGHAVDGSLVPGLAGQAAPRLVELLQGFKRGERSATVMHQLAKGYSDAQIDALAGYFARQAQ